MAKVLVKYETGIKADYQTIRGILEGAGYVPTQIIGKTDGIFECRFPDHEFLLSHIVESIFNKSGLEVRSLQIK